MRCRQECKNRSPRHLPRTRTFLRHLRVPIDPGRPQPIVGVRRNDPRYADAVPGTESKAAIRRKDEIAGEGEDRRDPLASASRPSPSAATATFVIVS